MHTLLDLRGNIPAFVHITDGEVHDVNVLEQIVPEAGAFYVMDRGYICFERLFALTLSAALLLEEGEVCERSITNNLNHAVQPKVAQHRSAFRSQMQLRRCEIAREQFDQS